VETTPFGWLEGPSIHQYTNPTQPVVFCCGFCQLDEASLFKKTSPLPHRPSLFSFFFPILTNLFLLFFLFYIVVVIFFPIASLPSFFLFFFFFFLLVVVLLFF
jgi:hypothetical protein